jgi:hypothetical protein
MKTGKYRHYKGRDYHVQGVARHSESGELLVVYMPLYGERGLWVRPLSMFEEMVQSADGPRPRFEYIGDD